MQSNQVGYDVGVAKLSIGSIDDIELQVTAQYNPSQLDMQRTVTWQRSGNKKDNRPDHRRLEPPDNDLEFTGGEGRSLTLELLFDGVETGTCVEPQIEALDVMATLIKELEDSDHDPRPHQCVIVWGTNGMRPLVCVIESLGVKYLMFDRTGKPLRAMATVKVKEASVSKFDRPRMFNVDRHRYVNGYAKGSEEGIPRYHTAVPSNGEEGAAGSGAQRGGARRP
jgi:hypothetical protein